MNEKIPAGFALSYTLPTHGDVISELAWSPNGHILAYGSLDNIIRLWNMQERKYLQIFRGHTRRAISVAWSPKGDLLASGSLENTIRLWNVQTGKYLRTLQGYRVTGTTEEGIESIAWSADGRLLASGSRDSTVRLWAGRTGEFLFS
jgi:WD40 repeat protein